MKKVLFSLALVLLPTAGAFADYTSDQVVDRFITAFSTLKIDQLNKTNFVEAFCKTAYAVGSFESDGNLSYDPDQSAFLTIACNKQDDLTAIFNKGVKRNSFLTNVITRSQCDGDDLSYCPFDKLFPSIYQALTNDYSNIRMANVYGVTSPTDPTPPQAEAFFDQYFWSRRDENLGAWMPDTADLQLCDPANCAYPDTSKLIISGIKKAQKLMTKSQVIDVAAIIKNTDLTSWPCLDQNISKHLLYCGLMSAEWADSAKLVPFVGLVYNELFYYQMLMQLYIYESRVSLTLEKSKSNTDLISMSTLAAIMGDDSETYRIQQELALSQGATSMMFRFLRDIEMTYPVHIGMSLYQEDVQSFMDTVAQIYTPLHQLSYTLRNVMQKK